MAERQGRIGKLVSLLRTALEAPTKSWKLYKWKQTRSQLNHLIHFLQANEGLKRSLHWTQPS